MIEFMVGLLGGIEGIRSCFRDISLHLTRTPRNWTVVSLTKTSVTFAHVDPADEGFPGTVKAQVEFYPNFILPYH